MLQAKYNKRCFLLFNNRYGKTVFQKNYYGNKKYSFSSQENQNKENESKGLMGKIKKFGKFGIIFYTAYVAAGFLGFFILLQYKFLKVDKVIDKFEEKGLNKYIDIRKKLKDVDPKYVNILAAYILNQVFEIIRFPTTLLILTYIFKKKK
jgi:hypothetical protein